MNDNFFTYPINAADLYGIRAKQIVGKDIMPMASAASSSVSDKTANHPAWSWVSFVIMLIIIRIIVGLAPEG